MLLHTSLFCKHECFFVTVYGGPKKSTVYCFVCLYVYNANKVQTFYIKPAIGFLHYKVLQLTDYTKIILKFRV